MGYITQTKAALMGGSAVIGAWCSAILGGWDTAIQTLILFMAADYITGLMAAGLQHSDKTVSGGLDSAACWRGLAKKAMTLVVVLIAVRLDLLLGTSFVRDAVVLAYIVNETISIVENAGHMGIPIPAPLKNAIEQLQGKSKPSGK